LDGRAIIRILACESVSEDPLPSGAAHAVDCTDWAAQLRRMQAHVERTRRAAADADADGLSADPSLPAGGAAQPQAAKDGLATVAAGSDETDADALD
jgi:hypothetical protein